MEIMVAEEGGRWVGLLPLAFFRSLKDGFTRVLEFSGGTQADRHDLLVIPGYEQAVLDLFEKAFEELKDKVRIMRLHSIPQYSVLLKWRATAGQEAVQETNVAPFLSLVPGMTYEGLEQQWSSSHRGDVRRQIRKLQKKGNLSLRRIGEIHETLRLIDEFFKVHTHKWARSNWRIILYNQIIKRFTVQLIVHLWSEGVIHFSTLNLDNKPISYHFGFLFEKRFYWYKPAYALEFQNYSPGKVHISELLREGLQQGWETFDFLLGDEAYKYLWTKDKDQTINLFVRG